jgi:hypothetical protein
LLKQGDIAVGGGLAYFSTMITISSWKLQHGATIVVPNAASSTMGSHEHGMEHTNSTGKTGTGSEKRLAIEGAGVPGVPPSPRDGRVSRDACKAASETPTTIEDLRGHLQSLRWCRSPWQLKHWVGR